MNNYQEYIENRNIERLTALIEKSEQRQLDEMLNYSCIVGDKEITQLLLKTGANPNIVLGTSQTPLHNAVTYGNHHLIKLLLENNTDINIQDINGDTPLHIAATIMHATILAELIDKAKLNVKNKFKQTPLDYAIKYGPHYNVVELLAVGGNSGKTFFNAIIDYAFRLFKEFINFMRVIIRFRLLKKGKKQ